MRGDICSLSGLSLIFLYIRAVIKISSTLAVRLPLGGVGALRLMRGDISNLCQVFFDIYIKANFKISSTLVVRLPLGGSWRVATDEGGYILCLKYKSQSNSLQFCLYSIEKSIFFSFSISSSSSVGFSVPLSIFFRMASICASISAVFFAQSVRSRTISASFGISCL